jgi:LDH2 family malate/lactate/ureidoglycolate dehydrogenase
MEIGIEVARKMSIEILIGAGFCAPDAKTITEHVIECEITGNGPHGLARLCDITNTKSKVATTTPIKISQNGNCVTVDGGRNNGICVMEKAVEAVISKLKSNAISMVAVKNYSGNTGVLGSYARKLADKDLISVFFGTTPPHVAPYGGTQAILGTNPIAFGIPNGENPVISDMSTSAMSASEIRIKEKKGEKLPPGVVLENGVQLPMAGHKGFAQGLIVDIFANLLTGAQTTGTMMMVFKPDIFISREQFAEMLGERLCTIKKSRLAPGFNEIRIPGDKYKKLLSQHEQSGKIQMDDDLYKNFVSLYNQFSRQTGQCSR